jgi:hypothetical protein
LIACSVLEIGALAGAEISVSHQTAAAQMVPAPEEGKAKTWVLYGISEQGNRIGKELRRLVGSPKMQFRWRNPEINPYIKREENRNTVTSRYRDVAMAMGQA